MVTFFQTLIRPDREESAQRAEVAKAANLLQVGEFQFLQLAYSEWYGEEMSEELINQLFMAYMLYDQVPFWARRHAHQILALDKQGELDENDPAYHRYDKDYGKKLPADIKRFIVTATLMVSIMTGIVWLSHLVAGESTSFLPPYFEKKEIKGTEKERNIEDTSLTPGRYNR